MTEDLYDFPAWLWRCLGAEPLTFGELTSAEVLRQRFGSFGVKLEPVGSQGDPDGVAAYKNGTHVASEVRQRTDAKGWYEALHRLCTKVAQAAATAA
jgi:hypothetical protein